MSQSVHFTAKVLWKIVHYTLSLWTPMRMFILEGINLKFIYICFPIFSKQSCVLLSLYSSDVGVNVIYLVWQQLVLFDVKLRSTKYIKFAFTQSLSYPIFWVQDQVPPFPSETAIAIVEEELGSPLASIFDHFDYEPIAAASLGNQCLTSHIFVIVNVKSGKETQLNVPWF